MLVICSTSTLCTLASYYSCLTLRAFYVWPFAFILLQESVDDIVGALGSILELKSESLLKMASDVAAKMVKLLPSSVLQAHVPHLVHHLLSLLSNRQLHVSISCATALNCILSNLSTKREKEVGEILKEGNTVFVLVMNVKDFSVGDKPTEYFQEMALLLSRILWRWPPSRFCVWSDSKFLDVLEIHKLNPESSLKAALLQLYSSLGILFSVQVAKICLVRYYGDTNLNLNASSMW